MRLALTWVVGCQKIAVDDAASPFQASQPEPTKFAILPQSLDADALASVVNCIPQNMGTDAANGNLRRSEISRG